MGVGRVTWIEVFLGGQAAAYLVASLADRDPQSGLGEIRARDETVGSGADDHDIEFTLVRKLLLHVPERIVRVVLEL